MQAISQQLPIPDHHIMFFKQVLDNASSAGLIDKKYSYKPRGCLICCSALSIGCLAPTDKRGSTVFAIVAVAFSFFVGLFFTVNSIISASTAKRQLRKAENPQLATIQSNNYNEVSISENNLLFNNDEYHQPPVNNTGTDSVSFYNDPQYLYPVEQYNHIPSAPPYNPQFTQENAKIKNAEIELRNTQVTVLNEKLKNLYQASANILQAQQKKYSYAASYQAILTIASGLLITALVISLVCTPLYNGIPLALGLGGGVGLIVGLVMLARREKFNVTECANFIRQTIQQEKPVTNF